MKQEEGKFDPRSGQEVKTLGDVLMYVRKRTLGWTRAELSNRTGIPSNSISKYELAGREGGQYPPLPKLAALCACMDIDVRVLMTFAIQQKASKDKLLKSDHSAEIFGICCSDDDQELLEAAVSKSEDIQTDTIVAKHLGEGSSNGKIYAIKAKFLDRYGIRRVVQKIVYLGGDQANELYADAQDHWEKEYENERELLAALKFKTDKKELEGPSLATIPSSSDPQPTLSNMENDDGQPSE